MVPKILLGTQSAPPPQLIIIGPLGFSDPYNNEVNIYIRFYWPKGPTRPIEILVLKLGCGPSRDPSTCLVI